ncbi:AAA family ATPase [Streptomyces atriruber]
MVGGAAEHAQRAPFVGRAAELGRLEALLGNMGANGASGASGASGEAGVAGAPGAPPAVPPTLSPIALPTVIDVVGDPGIGKTRLLAEFGALARARGMTVLRGRASERVRDCPLRPFSDAFTELDPRARSAFPSLAGLPAAVRGGGSPDADGDLFALCRDTADALGGLGGRGLVVVLDDLHWADEATVELLDHLVRHPVRAPFLLAVARRERQSSSALSAVLLRGHDSGAVLRTALGPLGRRELSTLAESAEVAEATHVGSSAEGLLGGPSRERATEMYVASEGNPQYFLALLRKDHAAPLLDELGSLTPLERAAVEAVAVLGPHANTDLIAAVTGADRDELITALRELLRRDLLRPDRRARCLVPRHPLLRTWVREAVDPWRRHELHRAAAAELTRTGAPLADRAHHVEESLSRWDPKAAAILTEAAEQAVATAPAVCARLLGAVLRVLPDTPEHCDTRSELMLRRATALGMTGAVKESRDLLHRLIAAHRPDPEGGDALRTSAVVQCAFMERHLGRYAAAGALLRRELDRRPGPAPAQRTGLVVEWGARALFANRYPEVRDELANALADARSRGDELGAAEVLTLAALGEAYEGETATARGHAAEAAALTDVTTDADLAGQCESLVRLAWSEVFLDDCAAALRHAERGVDIARRTGRPFALSQLLLIGAYARLTTGRVIEALELADESVVVASTLGGRELLGFSRAVRAMILMQARPAGDPGVLAAAEEAAATVGAVDGWWATVARCLLAYAALGAGDPYRVRDVLLDAGGDCNLSRVQPSMRPNFFELLVASALATGDVADAERWAARALGEADRLGLPVQRGAALRSVGLVAARRGEQAAAAGAFTEAARECARAGAVLREAQGLLLGAPFVAATGDGARAAAMSRRGRRLAEEGGARLLLDVAARAERGRPDQGRPGQERVGRRRRGEARPDGAPTGQWLASTQPGSNSVTQPGSPTVTQPGSSPGTQPGSSSAVQPCPSSLFQPGSSPAMQPGTPPVAPPGTPTAPPPTPVVAPALHLPASFPPFPPAQPVPSTVPGARGDTSPPPPDPFTSLTPREREISALVAEGLTNQAVAERLCLSTRTVESHVGRIYRKTGVASRAALASLVTRCAAGPGQSSCG